MHFATAAQPAKVDIKDPHRKCVGHIAFTPGGTFTVTLAEPWEWIAQQINAAIRDGRPLLDRDGQSHVVTNKTTSRLAIIDTIRALSERQLHMPRV